MEKIAITRKMLIKKKEKSLNRFIIGVVIVFCVALLAFGLIIDVMRYDFYKGLIVSAGLILGVIIALIITSCIKKGNNYHKGPVEIRIRQVEATLIDNYRLKVIFVGGGSITINNIGSDIMPGDYFYVIKVSTSSKRSWDYDDYGFPTKDYVLSDELAPYCMETIPEDKLVFAEEVTEGDVLSIDEWAGIYKEDVTSRWGFDTNVLTRETILARFRTMNIVGWIFYLSAIFITGATTCWHWSTLLAGVILWSLPLIMLAIVKPDFKAIKNNNFTVHRGIIKTRAFRWRSLFCGLTLENGDRIQVIGQYIYHPGDTIYIIREKGRCSSGLAFPPINMF